MMPVSAAVPNCTTAFAPAVNVPWLPVMALPPTVSVVPAVAASMLALPTLKTRSFCRPPVSVVRRVPPLSAIGPVPKTSNTWLPASTCAAAIAPALMVVPPV